MRPEEGLRKFRANRGRKARKFAEEPGFASPAGGVYHILSRCITIYHFYFLFFLLRSGLVVVSDASKTCAGIGGDICDIIPPCFADERRGFFSRTTDGR